MESASGNKVTFQIEESLLVLSENSQGWKKEVNRVSWNGKEAKIDLRSWSPSHSRMSKGITLTDQEWQALVSLIKSKL